MNTFDNSSNRVGYGRPPMHSRFQPGQSGNPNGRPKRRRSFKADFAAALDAVTAGDVTRQQQLADDVLNDALARDPVARKIAVAIALSLDDDSDDGEEEALDQKLLEDFNRRKESASGAEGGGNDD